MWLATLAHQTRHSPEIDKRDKHAKKLSQEESEEWQRKALFLY